MSKKKRTELSGYRIMWVMVLFDLPVVADEERKAATRFRNSLKDMGFEMAQFSVYARWTTGKDKVKSIIGKVQDSLPEGGKVDILQFTDKQYENIISFHGKQRDKSQKNPDQYVLF
ncbi:MAG: CRISPR-associated endoribonuclease Cas2 [Rhodomicrobium sp.]|nr:MAG: CRISPR-associated endoribonuclease Cas2 [Rhodomicrobium sp.]